jgi:chemotaxis protein MotA
MDRTTLPGILIGLGAMVLMVIMEGGNVGELASPAAAVIVFGGCFGALLASYPMSDVARFPKVISRAFGAEVPDPYLMLDQYVKLAEKARREGLLALEQDVAALTDRFTRKGLMLVVDGVDPEMVQEILHHDLEGLRERHENNIAMFEALGGYGPTMGIIGTVMGLVNVLGNLADPSNLGRMIASAFIATLYGVGSANIIWLPIANKLRLKSEREIASRQLAISAIKAIAAGDNPRIVREKLEAHRPPAPAGKEAKADASASGATDGAKAPSAA